MDPETLPEARQTISREMAKVPTLPNELLLYIFEDAMEQSRLSLASLRLVCRHWDGLIVQGQQFWSAIHVHLDWTCNLDQFGTMIETHLTRSRASLLDISITIGGPLDPSRWDHFDFGSYSAPNSELWDSEDEEELEDESQEGRSIAYRIAVIDKQILIYEEDAMRKVHHEYVPVIGFLRGTNSIVAKRWRSLRIFAKDGSEGWMGPIIRALPADAPCLERIKCSTFERSSDSFCPEEGQPLLRSNSLVSVSTNDFQLLQSLGPKTQEQIRELEMPSLDADIFLRISKQFKSLRKLSLTGLPAHPPSVAESWSLPKIQELYVTEESIQCFALSRLDAPSLEHFVVRITKSPQLDAPAYLYNVLKATETLTWDSSSCQGEERGTTLLTSLIRLIPLLKSIHSPDCCGEQVRDAIKACQEVGLEVQHVQLVHVRAIDPPF